MAQASAFARIPKITVLVVLGLTVIHSTAPAADASTRKENGDMSADIDFVVIQPGHFAMGSPTSDREARDFEKPQHDVMISRSFAIGRFEITQRQWEAVMGENPYQQARSNPFYGLPGMKERITHPDHPATVSWNDAQAFIAVLNAREPEANYRLPTEAEWEYVARAGTDTRYSFGDNDGDLPEYAWYGGDFATGGTHPVGTKKPNPWGLHDIHGNVWEWVADWYSGNYYASSPRVDPQGPDHGIKRVVRGGSWHATADSWRTAFRRDYAPAYRGISIGFRLARDPIREINLREQ